MIKNLETKIKPYLIHPICMILCGLLPCLAIVFWQITAEKKLDHLIQDALYCQGKRKWLEKKEMLQKALAEQLQTAALDYLEKEVETLQFMLPEIQKLHALLHAETHNEPHRARLMFLQNGENSLRFRLHNFQKVGNLQEMEATQIHPVEMNKEDLKNLLARVENVQIDQAKPGNQPPDLLIKNFELIKKPLPTSEETFLVKLDLIKREMLHE